MKIIKLVSTGYQKLFNYGEIITEFPSYDWKKILKSQSYYLRLPKLVDEKGIEVVPVFKNYKFMGFKRLKGRQINGNFRSKIE